MKKFVVMLSFLGCLFVCLTLLAQQKNVAQREKPNPSGFDAVIRENAEQLADEGKQTFRFDTFGDEAYRGGMLKLQLHRTPAILRPSRELNSPFSLA